MVFDKYKVAFMLSKEGFGRKKILECIYNRNLFEKETEIKENINIFNKHEVEVVSYTEDLYPKLLKEISDFPLLLFTKGDKELLKKPKITVVGTRKISKYGKWAVKYILKPLKDLDIAVVSGLARGIDARVHEVCLEFGIPTIAVVAGGINVGYPKSNQSIYNQISNKGLILSEFPPDRKVVKGMFPMRNRILAGISLATVIVESDIKGGSLITMNLALDYGREIFAIPCNISSFSLQGCNMCIEQGATPLFLPEQLYNFCKNVPNSC